MSNPPPQAVLFNTQTNLIVNRGPLPGNPEEPIPGLAPELKWLIVYQPFVEPTYDERYNILNVIETVTTDPHPQYPLYHQFKITFEVVLRPTSEIIEAARRVEQEALMQVFKLEDQVKLLTFGEAVIFQILGQQSLNPKQQAVRTRLIDTARKLWENESNRETKEAAIIAGQQPNLDQGYNVS